MLNNVLFYLVIYSFLGWCVESIYKTISERKFINSGFLYGPFCPIYGFGAVIMILLLNKLPQNIFLIFFVSMILLTMWEYLVGVLLEKIFKTKYWDYSDLKFNINGRICLKNSIYWGILGVVFTFIMHPFISNMVNKIEPTILFHINIILYIILITDMIITVNKILFIDDKIRQLYEISDKIKEKINELKQSEKLGKVANQNIATIINELKEQQAILKIKIYKLIIRLKKAFPTMQQSEAISKFIDQKIDLKKIKNKIRKNKGE